MDRLFGKSKRKKTKNSPNRNSFTDQDMFENIETANEASETEVYPDLSQDPVTNQPELAPVMEHDITEPSEKLSVYMFYIVF